jgi:hypothetical protein
MPKLVQPVTATVELVTALKEGNFGPYRSVLFKNGDEKIWQSFDPDAEELAVLSRGVQVQLVPRGESKQGKTQYNIVLLSAPASSTPMTKRATLSAAKKYEVAAHIEQMAKMYRFCFEQAQIALTGATEDRATVLLLPMRCLWGLAGSLGCRGRGEACRRLSQTFETLDVQIRKI